MVVLKLKKIFFVFVYLLCILIFIETSSRFLLSNDTFFKLLSKGDRLPEAIWRLKWIKEHRKSGNSPLLTYTYDMPHPTFGWVTRPHVKDLVVFRDKRVNSNSKGVRGQREFSYEKPAEKIRILILGDSFSFGEEVSDHETFSHYLQEMLPSTEIINMAVHGYGHDQMLLYFKEEGIKYNPDIVILGYLRYDNQRNLLGFRDYAKPRFKVRNGQLALKGPPIPEPKAMLRNEWRRLKFFDLLSIIHYRFLQKTGWLYPLEDKITHRILEELTASVNEVQANLIMAYLDGIPTGSQTVEITEADKAFFQNWQAKAVPVIYLHPLFVDANRHQIKLRGPRFYGHFSPEEHYLIALGIKNYLIDHHFVKP